MMDFLCEGLLRLSAKLLMWFLQGLLRDLIKQFFLPLKLFLCLFIAKLIESIHVCEVLVYILKLCISYGLFHLEIVHQLGRVRVTRALC
jgi:hypothetical protein